MRTGSPPARGRGLKQTALDGGLKVLESPPARGRGLKHFADAFNAKTECRPPRGGVD